MPWQSRGVSYHLYREVLFPFRIERLLLGLRLVHPLAVEVEDNVRVRFATPVDTADTVTVEKIDTNDTLV